MTQQPGTESPYERMIGSFLISTDRAKLDIEEICRFLSRSYWADTRPREVTERSIEHSLCFGVYRIDPCAVEAGSAVTRQVGFARVITDRASFAYLCDVFVAEEVRGQGLGKRLVEAILDHPDLQGLRRWLLATGDAHGLYRQFGFTLISKPERWMEKFEL